MIPVKGHVCHGSARCTIPVLWGAAGLSLRAWFLSAIGTFVRAQAPRRQLAEIVERCALTEHADPLSRCLTCNEELKPAAPELIDEQVPPRAHEAHDHYVQCPTCGSVYWAGTHAERMQELIDDVLSSE